MIPRVLSEWTLPKLQELLKSGVYEAEFFDFKEYRQGRKSEAEKQEMRKDCCAFANSAGGFLIFGVTNDRAATPADRLVGVDRSFEFNLEYGEIPRGCKPSVTWTILPAPINLGNGKDVHVVHIPRSWRGPHGLQTEKPQDGWFFPKRTNKGNEYMNYEEVRMSFLGYYEKRVKLQLLRAEIETVLNHAQIMESAAEGTDYSTMTLHLTVIESVLVDTYAIIHESPGLVQALRVIRETVRLINNNIENFLSIVPTRRDQNSYIESHNQFLKCYLPGIVQDARQVLLHLDAFLKS